MAFRSILRWIILFLILLNVTPSIAADGEQIPLHSCSFIQSLVNISLIGHGYKVANLSSLSSFKIQMQWLNNQNIAFDAVLQARLIGSTIVAANVHPSSN
jgi:hypothetical protein